MNEYIFDKGEDKLLIVGDWEVRENSKTIYIQQLDDDLQVIRTTFYEVNLEKEDDDETTRSS